MIHSPSQRNLLILWQSPKIIAKSNADTSDFAKIYIRQFAQNTDFKPILVAEHTYHYTFRRCLQLAPDSSDFLVLSNSGSGYTVAVVDGTFNNKGVLDCEQDGIYSRKINSELIIPDLHKVTDGCSTRFVVFSEYKSLFTQSHNIIPEPTAKIIDKFPVVQKEQVSPQIHVWIVTDDIEESINEEAPMSTAHKLELKANTEFALLHDAWRENLSGISTYPFHSIGNISVKRISEPSKVSRILKIANWELGQGFCDNVEDLYKMDNVIEDGAINVYYVDEIITGKTCTDSLRRKNIIFIGENSHPSTLAHEFGHAFSLAHTQHVPGMSTNNYMWFRLDAGNRDQFTLAQSFRMNRYPLSVLNQNGTIPTLGLDSGPQTVNCPDTRSDGPWSGYFPHCPPIITRTHEKVFTIHRLGMYAYSL